MVKRSLDALAERYAGAEVQAMVPGVRAHVEELAEVAAALAGRFLLLAGNGGSMAQAQHLAAEMAVGLTARRRIPYAAHVLGGSPPTVTAAVNDLGGELIFAQEARPLLLREDTALIAFSTSGRSPNVLRVAELARECARPVVAVTGRADAPLAGPADYVIPVATWAGHPDASAASIQVGHLVVIHLLVALIEREVESAARSSG